MKILWLILAGLLCIPSFAWADPPALSLSLLGQGRQNTRGDLELPTNGTLGGFWTSPDGAWSGRTRMRWVRDLNLKLDDYDLYLATLHARPLEGLEIDLGRQFLTEGFSAQVVDGLATTLHAGDFIDVRAYSGIPRSVESGDFNRDDGLLTGMSVGTTSAAPIEARVHAAWSKNRIDKADFKTNDEIRIGTALSRSWKISGAPTTYALGEYNTTSKVVEAGTFGIAVNPSRRIALNLEGNYFNISRLSERPSVLALFGRGPMATARGATTLNLIRDHLDLQTSYTYQRLDTGGASWKIGQVAEVSLPIGFEWCDLTLAPATYFAKSFGGTLYGGRLGAVGQWTQKFSTEAGFDLAKYTKVTHNNDTALASYLWGTYRWHSATVALGGEYNRSGLLEEDIRGTVRMEYHYGDIR